MGKGDLAELILSLFSPREHASAVTGDLLEESDSGACRFWFMVARTALSQLWRQTSQAPFSMAGAATRGLLAEFGYALLAQLVNNLMLLLSLYVFHFRFAHGAHQWIGYFMTWLVVPLQVGRWMARRYPGREASGILAFMTLHFALSIGFMALWEIYHLAGGAGEVIFSRWDAAFLGLYPIPLFVGAAFERARQTKTALI